MFKGGLCFWLDQAFSGFRVFKTYSDALSLSDFAWSNRRLTDNLELMTVVAKKGRNDLLPSGAYFHHMITVDLEKDRQ